VGLINSLCGISTSGFLIAIDKVVTLCGRQFTLPLFLEFNMSSSIAIDIL
jgi:hypothetical protein